MGFNIKKMYGTLAEEKNAALFSSIPALQVCSMPCCDEFYETKTIAGPQLQ